MALGRSGVATASSRTASSVTLPGQQAQLGPSGPFQAAGHLVDEVVDAVAEGVGAAVAVDAREGAEEVELGRDEAATGAADRHQGGDLAVDLGVERVAEAELELGAEDVAHGRAVVGPARRRGDDVEAEGEAARGELLDLHLEVVELGAQRAPAVDDEEDVAPAVVGAALRAARAVGLDRVDAVARGSRPRGGRRCPRPPP